MNMTSIKATQKKTSKRAIKVAKSPKATEQMWENEKNARKSSTQQQQQQQEDKRDTLNGARLKVMTLKHTLNTHTLTLVLIYIGNYCLFKNYCCDLGIFISHYCVIRIFAFVFRTFLFIF